MDEAGILLGALVRRCKFDFDRAADAYSQACRANPTLAPKGCEITAEYCRKQFAIVDIQEQKAHGEFTGSEYTIGQVEEILGAKTNEQLESDAEEMKKAGNKCFMASDMDGAMKTYTTGIDELSKVLKLDMSANDMRIVPNAAGREKLKIQRLLGVLHSNRSQVHLKLGNYQSALDDNNVALVHEPKYGKAMLRKAQALCGLKDFEHAMVVLTEAAEAVPSEAPSFQALLETVSQQFISHQQERKHAKEGKKEGGEGEGEEEESATKGIDDALNSMEDASPEFKQLLKEIDEKDEMKAAAAEGGAAESSLGSAFDSAAGAIVLEDWHIDGAGKNNGHHRWRQTFDELTVVFPVDADVTRRQIRCCFKPKKVSVKLNGVGADKSISTSLMEAELCGAVHVDECSWVLEDASAEERALWTKAGSGEEVTAMKQLVVYLGKATVGERNDADVWSGLVKGGITIDTSVLAIDQQHQAQKLQQLNVSARSGMKSAMPKSLAASGIGGSIFDKLLKTGGPHT
jgi:tetratricopeptide (TPR) repeat protein